MEYKRVIGKFLYNTIASKMPVSGAKVNFFGKSFRRFCGRLFLDNCGVNINIEKGAKIGNNVSLGNNSGIGINSFIGSNVVIGDNVMMGPDCVIYTRNHEFRDTTIPMVQQGFQDEKPVMIDDDVWIGGRVTILPGVHIHSGCIVGAGAVVTKDVEAKAIVAGNPAKVVKMRN